MSDLAIEMVEIQLSGVEMMGLLTDGKSLVVETDGSLEVQTYERSQAAVTVVE